jgi:tellurium resistance protein TerD
MTDEINYVTSSQNNITIGDDVGLTNKDPTLRKIMVGVGWDVASYEGSAPDLDVSAFLLNKEEETRMDEDFVFYNNRRSSEEEVIHRGDNRTGAGEGDDETIDIDLQALSFDVTKIVLSITIHEGGIKEQDFSMVKNLFLRIVNSETNMELCRLDVPDDFLNEKKGYGMRIGEIFRDGPKWRFIATCRISDKGGLDQIARDYGILIA